MVAAFRYPSLEAPDDRLFARCLFCGSTFPRSALFNHVPPGDRLAYDPERGRVWSICGSCTRWNLIPAEERFDAIDALERAVRDRALYLAATAHISLHQVEDLSIIRVGQASLVERTAWRYGRELLARNANYWRPRTRYVAAAAGAVAILAERLGGFSLDRDWGPSGAADILRWQRFGSVAWNGRARCDSCGSILHTLHFDSSWWLYPRIQDGRLVVGVPCTRCDPWTPDNVFDLDGEAADAVLRRSLAYQHIAGATERDLVAAVTLLERAGSAERLITELSTGRTSLYRLGRVHTISLDIAANELAERRALQLRLHGLESEWRLEEAMADIVDDELS
jgi:hypothetical protein